MARRREFVIVLVLLRSNDPYCRTVPVVLVLFTTQIILRLRGSTTTYVDSAGTTKSS